MTEQQADTVLNAATGKPIGYVTVVKIGNYRQAAAHAASEASQLACGTKPRKKATIEHIRADLADTTCQSCRNQLGLDDTSASDGRLEALFVLAISLGLRPGELRALTSPRPSLQPSRPANPARDPKLARRASQAVGDVVLCQSRPRAPGRCGLISRTDRGQEIKKA